MPAIQEQKIALIWWSYDPQCPNGLKYEKNTYVFRILDCKMMILKVALNTNVHKSVFKSESFLYLGLVLPYVQ